VGWSGFVKELVAKVVGTEVTTKVETVKMKEMLGSIATVVVTVGTDVVGLMMEVVTVAVEG
jgi:hypothetical protein